MCACGKPILDGRSVRCPDCQLAYRRESLRKRVDAKKQTETETEDVVERIRSVRPPGQARLPPPKTDAQIVDARDAAMLSALSRSEHGVLSFRELLRALPADDPAVELDDREQAVKHALTRLKVKGQIGRTGEVYSLVGAGLAANG